MSDYTDRIVGDYLSFVKKHRSGELEAALSAVAAFGKRIDELVTAKFTEEGLPLDEATKAIAASMAHVDSYIDYCRRVNH